MHLRITTGQSSAMMRLNALPETPVMQLFSPHNGHEGTPVYLSIFAILAVIGIVKISSLLTPTSRIYRAAYRHLENQGDHS